MIRRIITLINDSIIKIIGIKKINLLIRINGVNYNVHINNIYYYLRLDSNLLSLETIKIKDIIWFEASSKLLIR